MEIFKAWRKWLRKRANVGSPKRDTSKVGSAGVDGMAVQATGTVGSVAEALSDNSICVVDINLSGRLSLKAHDPVRLLKLGMFRSA